MADVDNAMEIDYFFVVRRRNSSKAMKLPAGMFGLTTGKLEVDYRAVVA